MVDWNVGSYQGPVVLTGGEVVPVSATNVCLSEGLSLGHNKIAYAG